MPTTAQSAEPWSDKGLGACARKAEMLATHHTDARFARRDAQWRREFYCQFGEAFYRLTRPNGTPVP